MAEAVSDNFSGRRETEVTSMFKSSSRLSFFSSPGLPATVVVCASAPPVQPIKANTIKLSAVKPGRTKEPGLPAGLADNSFICSDDSQTANESNCWKPLLSEGTGGLEEKSRSSLLCGTQTLRATAHASDDRIERVSYDPRILAAKKTNTTPKYRVLSG